MTSLTSEHGPRSVQFGMLDNSGPAPGTVSNIRIIDGVPLELTARLGVAKRSVEEILQLSVGSVIDLDKVAGQPADIILNDKTIARGDIAEVDGHYAVRLTEIIR